MSFLRQCNLAAYESIVSSMSYFGLYWGLNSTVTLAVCTWILSFSFLPRYRTMGASLFCATYLTELYLRLRSWFRYLTANGRSLLKVRTYKLYVPYFIFWHSLLSC